MSSALIIAAARQDALEAALRDAGCTDVDTAPFDEASALLAVERRALVVADIVEAEDADRLAPLADGLRGTPLLAIAPEHLLEAAFEAGATDCIATPIRGAELTARLRAALRCKTPSHRRSRRERRLTEELHELQRQKQELERIACVDSLTGIANRRHALSLLDAEWKRSARDGTPLSLVMVDLDCFHAFNEHYGHLGGDRCLRQVTDCMVRCLRRPSDFLGRYGGEEFFAVLAGTDAEGAAIVAERMRAAVESLGIPHEKSQCAKVVTMSVGFATCRPTLNGNAEALVNAADHALLAAKADGRNRIQGQAPTRTERPRLASTPWRRFPPVIADPWFADRIPPFLASTRDEITRLRDATTAGTFDRIRALSRRLRVSAGEHQIETIAELAGMLERAARAGDAESLYRVLDELDAYVAHVQVTYRRPIELERAG
ncbi:MAG: diguanylate cyclase [Deltaproteobacteria bacterium]|nr:diguanylate cyclase [Deltaproteobacteria bacterium]